MKQVMIVRGKSRQVFKYMDLLKRQKGNVTIKELSKANKTFRLDLRS